MSATRVLRIAGWLGVGLVVILSVIPADVQIRTGASKWLEHAAAYFLLGSVLACAYGTARRSVQWIALLLIGLSGSLEIIQNCCPGRTPSLDDWFGGMVGGTTAMTMYLALKGLREG